MYNNSYSYNCNRISCYISVLSKSGKHKENVNEETTVNNEKQTDSVTEAARQMRENRYRHL